MATTIHFTDGHDAVAPDAKPFDLVAFERKFAIGVSELMGDFRLEHTLFIAWHALKRTGQYDGDFEAFLNDVDDFDSGDDSSEAVPLELSAP